MPIRYQREILQQHADALYARADSVVLGWALASAFNLAMVGAIAGGGVAFLTDGGIAGFVMAGLGAGAILGFALGWAAGQQQAFKLRLQAQEVLCRMMVEKNTADLLRLAASDGTGIVQLGAETLEQLRPGRSLSSRMGRLG